MAKGDSYRSSNRPREKRNELSVNFRVLEAVSLANAAYERIKLAEECGWKEWTVNVHGSGLQFVWISLNVMRDTC